MLFDKSSHNFLHLEQSTNNLSIGNFIYNNLIYKNDKFLGI
jgi:hypothetical protein